MPRPLTPTRPWEPMTHAEWVALMPYVWHRAPQGRRVGDLRARMDAIFEMACRGYGVPWRDTPAHYGKPDTVARFFRRLTHNGLWHRLLEVLADPELAPDTHPLRRIEYWICKACRRAARLGGLRLLFLIRRLDIRRALDGPPWLLPDPLYDRVLRRTAPDLLRDPPEPEPWRRTRSDLLALVRALKLLHRWAAGRARLPRSVRLAW